MDIIMFSTVLVPVVIGLVEAIKRGFGVNERWAPVVSIFVGIGLTLLGGAAGLIIPSIVVAGAVWYGLLAGLSASGLYSGVRALSTTP